MDSFLGYIANQYGHKKEDVATDTLTYLLQYHKTARKVFGQFLAQFSDQIPEKYKAKSRTKIIAGGIPDLQVLDEDDNCLAIVENKFGARLTDNQPVGYFQCLKEDACGLILFVVPRKRMKGIWSEVEQLCRDNSRPLQEIGGRYFGISGKDKLKVVSWDELLEYIKTGIAASSCETSVSVFVKQLKELCDVVEEERIEPLDSEELLSGYIGRRIRSYSRLAEAIVEASYKEKCFLPESEKDQKKLGASGLGFEGLYGKMVDYTAWIGFGPEYWAKHGITPLWLIFDEENEVEELAEKSRDWLISKRCFLIPSNNGDIVAFPLNLQPNVEQEQVVDAAVRQLKEIAALIKSDVK